MAIVNIIELNQKVSVATVEAQPFDGARVESYSRKSVDEDDEPTLGTIWFAKGLDGNCKLWKVNLKLPDHGTDSDGPAGSRII